MTTRLRSRKGFLLALPLVGALSLATAACHSDASANQGPHPLTSRQAKTAIGDVAVGHQVAADGLMTGDQKGNNFTAGQPVIVAFRIGRAPVGTLVHLDWSGPGNQTLGGDEKSVSRGQTTMSFTKVTTGWGKGTYGADLYVDGNKVDTEHFEIVDSGNGSASQP
jgi:hypothetical protein